MHDKKFSIIALCFGAIALALSIYATVGAYNCSDDTKFNTKVETGIQAYIKKQQDAAQAAAQPPAPTGPVDVSMDDDAVRGDADATVTIVEFSEYQCPYCGRHANGPLKQIKENYVDTGKVKYVFRDFPLGFHQNAKPAAMAAECVKEKGGDDAYYKYHDLLFQNQSALDADSLKKYASDMGYDIASCLDSGKYSDEVDADMKAGQDAGVQGVPATFINGRLISGAQPYENFEKIIEEELSK